MKSQIKTIIVAAWLLLAPNQMLAWQEQDVSDEQSAASAESGANANGTDDAKNGATAQLVQGSGIKPSTPHDDAPPEYLDGAFLLGPGYGQVLVSTRPRKTGQPTRIDYLQLSEEQVAEVKTLSEHMLLQMAELDEAMRNSMIDRGGSEAAAVDQEKAQRLQQQQNREAIALKMRIGRAFMELLSEPQRNEMYRWSIIQGGTFALLEPFLREKFHVTEAQVASLHKIRDENWRKLSVHFLHVSALHSKDAEPLLAKAYEQLTDEQKAQYQQFIATSFVEGKAGEADQPADAKQPGTAGMPGTAGGPTGQGGGFFPSGGFGGSAFGGGVPFENARQVSSNGLMITWSENNDELRGFSNSKGDWEVLKIEKQDRIIPVVADEVAAVRIGDSMAAFSAVKAQWDVIKLSEGSTAVPVVFDGYTKVEDNGNLYTFAAAKGQWTSPTDPEFTRASMELELKNGNLASLRNQFDEWLKSLPRYKGRAVRVMFSENKKNAVARIDTDRKSLLKEVEARLNELSASSATADAVSSTESNTGDVSLLETQVTTLREELEKLELSVRENAGTKSSPGQKEEDHHRELRNLVEQSFDLRQQMQRLEAQRMKLKLQFIETNLDAREKAREAIIDRHMEDLQTGKGESTTLIPSQKMTNPGVRSPNEIHGQPHIPIRPSAGFAVHQASSDGMQWPQPKEIVKELRELKLSVTQGRAVQSQIHLEIEKWSKPLEQLISEGFFQQGHTEEQRLEMLASAKSRLDQPTLDTLRLDWNNAWSAYQSRLRLLELDVDEAKISVASATADYERMRQLADQKAVATHEVRNASDRASAASFRLQRAKELLKLYVDIETQEPELNPDSLKE